MHNEMKKMRTEVRAAYLLKNSMGNMNKHILKVNEQYKNTVDQVNSFDAVYDHKTIKINDELQDLLTEQKTFFEIS